MVENKKSKLDVDKFIGIINNPIRRKILQLIKQNNKITYTSLLNTLDIDAGKLNFHLRQLSPLIIKEEDGYRLGELGIKAISMIDEMSEMLEDKTAVDLESRSTNDIKILMLLRRGFAYLADVIFLYFIVFGTLDFSLAFTIVETNVLGVSVYLPVIFIDFLSRIFLPGFFDVDLTTRIYRLYSATIFWIYCTLMESYKGQTLGKILMRIRVVKDDESPLNIIELALRNFVKAFFLPFDLLFGIYSFVKMKKIRFFDYYVGSTVVDAK